MNKITIINLFVILIYIFFFLAFRAYEYILSPQLSTEVRYLVYKTALTHSSLICVLYFAIF